MRKLEKQYIYYMLYNTFADYGSKTSSEEKNRKFYKTTNLHTSAFKLDM